ncbi:phospholipase A-2-activating protein [Coprinopsis sp. MPI-PUGE-AT-0042]|nr:phospholipase A-2-activating protein [Coprinopsis sp. MPI-PUGE-AT-0042]
MASKGYKLSATLKGHSSDVRALAAPTNDLVLSASRDTTAIAWNRSAPGSHEWTNETVLRAGSRYINAVGFVPPTPDAPKGYAVTAGQETVINLFDLSKPRDDPNYTLVGHTENVCTLDVSPAGTIISGSWDKTAKVWKNFSLVHELKGHQQSVWAVKIVEEDTYLTASADRTIRLWKDHKTIHTFTGHQDAVRGLALVPDLGFASCSNDSEIRVWTLGGDLIYSLSGHTSFVYSLAVLPDGGIVSSGEDRTVRVWQDGECSQTIVHPAISVWAVAVLPNGDIVSGTSDGVVRVFSAAEERWASSELLQAYDHEVASQALPSHQVGDVKKSDLPGLEALNTPGKKAGEVKMVKNNDVVEAHQWDSASNTWQKIGDVVDAVGQGRKQLYQGKEYDYVFDVDIQDGVPPLKLPYNVADNPYSAAQRFLQSNELPLSYIDQVVQFIEKNTAGVNIGTGGEEYVDPFTGASRYRANAGASPGPAAGTEYMDPFTGASRYRAQPQPSAAAPTGGSDPWTGASRYTGTPATPAPPASKILPVSSFATFKQANVSAMQGKIFQFNEALQQEITTSSLAFYPDDRESFNAIFANLSKLTATPSTPPAEPLNATHVEHVIGVLERWPASQRFPILDLSRLLLGYCLDAFAAPGTREKFIQALFTASEWNTPWSSPLPKHRETNLLLLLRSLANAFQEGSTIDGEWLNKLLETLGEAPFTIFNKNQRVALSTILFNISCVALKSPIPTAARQTYLVVLLAVLNSEKADSEAAYRALVALGNTVHTSKKSGNALDQSQVGEIRKLLTSVLPSAFPEDRVRSLSQEIISAL